MNNGNASFNRHITEQRRLRLVGSTQRSAPKWVYNERWKNWAFAAEPVDFFIILFAVSNAWSQPHGTDGRELPTLSRSLNVGHFTGTSCDHDGTVGMKNGCTMLITCAFVSGSSNAIVAALERSMSLGIFGRRPTFTPPCVVLPSPA